MLEIIGIAVLAIFMHFATAEQPKELVVLLAEADGTTGSVVVSSRGSEQRLEQAGQATQYGAATGPSAPFIVSEDRINELFGDALAAQPILPVHFLLYFKHDSDELVPESAQALPEILKVIGQRPVPQIVIIGHTDTVGAADYNHQLGFQRAQLIYDAIVAIGADPSRIRIESHGESNLLVPTPDNVSEPKNRRVEVSVR